MVTSLNVLVNKISSVVTSPLLVVPAEIALSVDFLVVPVPAGVIVDPKMQKKLNTIFYLQGNLNKLMSYKKTCHAGLK